MHVLSRRFVLHMLEGRISQGVNISQVWHGMGTWVYWFQSFVINEDRFYPANLDILDNCFIPTLDRYDRFQRANNPQAGHWPEISVVDTSIGPDMSQEQILGLS